MASAAEEARKAAARIDAKAKQSEGRIEAMVWKNEQSGQRLDRAIQNAEGRQSFWYSCYGP